MRQEARIQFKNTSKMLKRLQTCRNNLWNRQELSRLWNWNRINVCSLPGSRDVGWDDDDGTGPGDRKHNLLEARVIHLVLSRHHCAKDSHLTKSICQCKNLKSLWTSNSSSLLQVVISRTHTNTHTNTNLHLRPPKMTTWALTSVNLLLSAFLRHQIQTRSNWKVSKSF